MEQAELFKFLAENIMENAIFFGNDGIIIYSSKSACAALGYDDMTELNICAVFPQIFKMEDEFLDFDTEILGKIDDYMAYRKNKTCFPAYCKIISASKGVYATLFYNVSDRQLLAKKVSRADAEAEEAEKVKTQFVANVTHELRTPVNGILGNINELISREENPDKLKILRLVERGCNDMHSIINNILNFSKLEAKKLTLEIRKFDFYNMIEYVKSNHINKITEKGLEFFLNISPDVPQYVMGDELRIVQILNNLLSNATKFTSVGKIALEIVKTEQVGSRIELFFLVIDTGIGIDKAGQDKLFKSFSQVEASTTRKYGGTGLGLCISKQLVELMNGDISVESEPGKGTMFSFHIWLELAPDEPVQDEAGAHTGFNSEVRTREEIVRKLYDNEDTQSQVWEYGTQSNSQELERKMSKMILSVEMDNWEKAEMFADTIKQLTAQAPYEIKSAALRLKMAVQKGDHDKTVEAFETLKNKMSLKTEKTEEE
jgi:nitrogen-specific signal transduction histidine kinase